MKIIKLITLVVLTVSFLNRAEARNEIDEYIVDVIKIHVWGGFESPEEINDIISDILEDGADEVMLREKVISEFHKKKEAEKSWAEITDFDRLNNVFSRLKTLGILCLHNVGYTMSDGHEDAIEELRQYPKGKFYGYCFYHQQDLERAMDDGGLLLAFDHIKGDVPEKINVAKEIQKELIKEGFVTEWDGTTDQRIKISKIIWQKRSTSSKR